MAIVVKKPWIEIGYYETGEIQSIAVMNNVSIIRWRNYDEVGCLKEEGTRGIFEKNIRKIYGENGSVRQEPVKLGVHFFCARDVDWEKVHGQYDSASFEGKNPVIQGISVTQSEIPELFVMNRRNAAIVRSFKNWLNGPRRQVVSALETTKGKAARRAIVEAYRTRTR